MISTFAQNSECDAQSLANFPFPEIYLVCHFGRANSDTGRPILVFFCAESVRGKGGSKKDREVTCRHCSGEGAPTALECLIGLAMQRTRNCTVAA